MAVANKRERGAAVGRTRLGEAPAGDGAPVTGSSAPEVRSATIENWSAAALGLPALAGATPAAMSTVTVPRGPQA